MTQKEEEFLKRLQAMFKIEAEEHIQVLSSCLIELEKKPDRKKYQDLVETAFREAHSLKGAARSVNRIDIESVCMVMESVFAKLKAGSIVLSKLQYDLLHNAIDAVSAMVKGSDTDLHNDNREIILQLQAIIADKYSSGSDEIPAENEGLAEERSEENSMASVQSETIGQKSEKDILVEPLEIDKRKFIAPEKKDNIIPEDKYPLQDTVRIQISKLDPIFLEAEQMIQSKIAYAQRCTDLNEMYNSITNWKSELKKWENYDIASTDKKRSDIINWVHSKLDETERNLFSLTHAMENDQRFLGRLVDEHVETVKKVLMLPVSTMAEVFPKLVRDIARSQGKEVELKINGLGIEVDKRILEELKDPLIHVLRNCVDHGIKNPKEREENKKVANGQIKLSFSVIDGRTLRIVISDDGEGINAEKVLLSAIKEGIVSREQSQLLSHQEILSLIFSSGLTTSPLITDISGRGLGLAIVNEKVGKLGGKISVDSKPAKGTTFNMELPLTLSTYRGVMVGAGEHLFYVPTFYVERAIRVKTEEIRTVENKETVSVGNSIIGLVKLSDVLLVKSVSKKEKSDYIQIIVLQNGNKRVGFVVDEIYDEHQILVKELGKQLVRVRNISGATVLGSGKVVAVLNVSDLMSSAVNTDSSIKETDEFTQVSDKIYKILVADDSITSRTLIKNILETSGYVITTAVDGLDAYTKAMVDDFDLIVSDVDMPRMSGFELTAKVRKEKKLSEIPVVLVTALESSEDKEHGIDVGASAYIVKSSFDQSNLLDVVKKLL